MKYIKKFEGKTLKFKVGDIIVLIDDDEENQSLTLYFKVGNLYKISYIDDADDALPYRLGYLEETETEELISASWVEEYRIRLAEPWELDQDKYNL